MRLGAGKPSRRAVPCAPSAQHMAATCLVHCAVMCSFICYEAPWVWPGHCHLQLQPFRSIFLQVSCVPGRNCPLFFLHTCCRVHPLGSGVPAIYMCD